MFLTKTVTVYSKTSSVNSLRLMQNLAKVWPNRNAKSLFVCVDAFNVRPSQLYGTPTLNVLLTIT